MSNNDIFKKLRVALHLKNDDIIAILKLVDFKISESELGAIFRIDDHPNFKPCGDQILRNFLNRLFDINWATCFFLIFLLNRN
jgi:uncharacterized protein YehS (DUF1456 family)